MLKKRPTEHQEQSAVIEWFDSYARTKGLSPRLLMAIPNGSMLAGDARMRAIQSHRLKSEGMRPKAPDLFLAVARGVFNGLFVEMKRSGWTRPKSGKAKKHVDEQYTVLELLALQSYETHMCVGADEVITVIKEYLNS